MSLVSDAARYAVYWAPEPAHPLWQRGCEWLGRDPSRSASGPPFRDATAEPRRYGFHATLTAPMHLRPGAGEADFVAAVQTFASAATPFEMPALRVGLLERFVALLPKEALPRDHALHRIADACVHAFDSWRAPLDEHTLARRLAGGALSSDQTLLLQRWGYPHVLDQWRFHMTLTDSLGAASARQALRSEAQRFMARALTEPLRFESLCIFREPAPRAPFELIQRFALAGRR